MKALPSFPLSVSPLVFSLLFYFGMGLIIFSPCLIQGEVYFDGDLNAFHIPVWEYLRSWLLKGHLPLWCPLLLGGQPFFADPNVMATYPPAYLFLIFSVPYTFGVFYFIHFALAVSGMHFWLKTLELSEDARRLGALLFVFSGFFWWEIIHPTILAAFAWIPWWGAALEKMSQRLGFAWSFVAGLVFAFLFFAGHFQMTLGALYGGGVYLVFRLLTRKDWRKNFKKDSRFLLAPFFFLWGALPLLILWIPAQEFLNFSERLNSHPGYESFQGDLSVNLGHLNEFLFPKPHFKPETGVTLPVEDTLANAGYLGPWALFLAALAFRRRLKTVVYFFAITAITSLLISLGKYFPLHRWLCLLAPGFEWTRAPFRYLFLYVTSLSILAAFGYENLIGESVNTLKKIWRAVGLYSLVFMGLGVWSGKESWPQWLGWGLGVLSFYFWFRTKNHHQDGKRFFGISLTLCLLLTAWNTCSSRCGPVSNLDIAANWVITKLKQQMGLGRVLIGDHIPVEVRSGNRRFQLELPANAAYVAGLRNALGYNPLVLDKTTDLYTLPPQTFTRLMAVQAFVTGDKRWHIPGFASGDQGQVRFYQNQEKVSFVYVPNQVESILDDGQRLAAMRRPDFKPYEQAYFSQTLPVSQVIRKIQPPAHLKYELSQDEPDDQTFQVQTDRSGWMVFSEINYPGWKAWVDRAASSILTANHVFRALWVSSGRHEVRFRYEPAWGKPLLFGGLMWILSVLILGFGPWRAHFWRDIFFSLGGPGRKIGG